MSKAVTVPESIPDRIPSPEKRTAANPEISAERYRQARDRGRIMESGFSEELAAAQEIRRRITRPAAQTAWDKRQESHMGLVFICIETSGVFATAYAETDGNMRKRKTGAWMRLL